MNYFGFPIANCRFEEREITQSAIALHKKCSNRSKTLREKKFFSRKGAKAQRKPLRNAAALCAFAPLREKSSPHKTFCAKPSAIS
jgi:hypothetical protein